MTTRPLIPLLALLLSGCATGQWIHPSKSQAEADKDFYDCRADGEQYAANLGANGNPLIIAGRIRECAAMKGYVWTKTVKPT